MKIHFSKITNVNGFLQNKYNYKNAFYLSYRQRQYYSQLQKSDILDNEYKSTIAKLYEVNRFSDNKINLDNISEACSALGNPHKGINYIHVTGTNGKGSVCKKLARYFELAGLNTGLFISPHITTFRERIQINSNYIDKESIVEIMKHLFDVCQKNNLKLNYFEYVTLLCFVYFKQKKIDIGVMEVGLGGNLDSTNVINPLLSVVTSIGLDHVDILGMSQEEIAEKKAGIIKSNVPCVIGVDCFPRKVFIDRAIANNSQIYILNNSNKKQAYEDFNTNNNVNMNLIRYFDESKYKAEKYKIKSEFKNNIFDFDYENKILTRLIIDIFNENYPHFSSKLSPHRGNARDFVNDKLLDQGIISKAIDSKQPCRMEDVFEVLGKPTVQKSVNSLISKLFESSVNNLIDFTNSQSSRIKKIYLDVGHNAHGIEKMLYSIRINNPKSFVRIVTGFSIGKDQTEILKILCSFSDKIYLASAKHSRAIPFPLLINAVDKFLCNYNINKGIFSHYDDNIEIFRKTSNYINKDAKDSKEYTGKI